MSGGHRHRYLPGTSPLHRASPHLKLLATILLVIAVVSTPREQPWAFACHAALLAVVAGIGRVPLLVVARRLTIELPFIAFAVMLPIVGRGPRVDVLGVSLSEQGLWGAWNIVAKATLGVAATVLLAATTPVPGLLAGLERLRVPRTLVAITAFMIRYGDVITDELRRARIARLSRGYDPRWLWQAKAVASSTGALFVRSYERGERVHLAMQSRGYAGTMPDAGRVDRRSDRRSLLCLILPVAAGAISAVAWMAM